MSRKTMALAVAIAAALLAACGGRYGSNTATGSSFTLPNMPDFKITATYPNHAGTGTIMVTAFYSHHRRAAVTQHTSST